MAEKMPMKEKGKGMQGEKLPGVRSSAPLDKEADVKKKNDAQYSKDMSKEIGRT